MLERITDSSSSEIDRYLETSCHENILLLSDLRRQALSSAPLPDPLSLIGYRMDGRLVAVQGFYRHGRWFPHLTDLNIADYILSDMAQRYVRWVMGVRHVLDPLLERLSPRQYPIDYDEHDYLCRVDSIAFRSHHPDGIRRSVPSDAQSVAALRAAFEIEYFGADPRRIDWMWCLSVANRYIEQGAYIAERQGQVVSMAAIEAELAGLAQIGAVFTTREYRNQGLARGVVSAVAEELLQRVPVITLVVKTDNHPALRAYSALGFGRWTDYRMVRFA